MDEADSDTDAAAVAELEQQIDMCNTQITDLQQKLIDADQGEDSVVLLFCCCLSLSMCSIILLHFSMSVLSEITGEKFISLGDPS